MRHIPDGVLRRLDDEPLAVPDRVTDHLDGCERCRSRRAEIAHDTELAAHMFAAPQLVPDLDVAWARLERELGQQDARRPTPVLPRRPRLPRVSLRAGLVIGTVGVVLAGTAAAATLTTVFAPTHVAAVSVSPTDLRALADFTGLGDGQGLGGLTTPNGSSTLRFGIVTWSSGAPRPAASRAQASSEAGFPVALPPHLPAGVGRVQQFTFQPHVRATVTFSAKAGKLAGSSVTVDAGPAVIAEYSGAAGSGVPTLAVMTMQRPTARSTGASISQIEAYLLSQPNIPPELAEEIRLLGNPGTTLPVPVPSGADVHSVRVDGSQGVLLADSSNAVSGVIWEDGRHLLHSVVGILDSQDVLNVARQLG